MNFHFVNLYHTQVKVNTSFLSGIGIKVILQPNNYNFYGMGDVMWWGKCLSSKLFLMATSKPLNDISPANKRCGAT